VDAASRYALIALLAPEAKLFLRGAVGEAE
jgi:hypothetical protein